MRGRRLRWFRRCHNESGLLTLAPHLVPPLPPLLCRLRCRGRGPGSASWMLLTVSKSRPPLALWPQSELTLKWRLGLCPLEWPVRGLHDSHGLNHSACNWLRHERAQRTHSRAAADSNETSRTGIIHDLGIANSTLGRTRWPCRLSGPARARRSRRAAGTRRTSSAPPRSDPRLRSMRAPRPCSTRAQS